jgi:putative nucleotidyltransferase with HDIG domain
MKRILFVDDEPKILEALQRMLRPLRNEWDMAFAPGGEAALTMLEMESFDVIVSDMRMPGIDGAALLDAVRERYPGMLRVILSGYTELEASFRAVPVAHQFLLKPCDPTALRAAIERATSLVDALNSKMLASLVGSLQDLPSVPRTFGELRATLADPDASIDQIVHIIERDVAISAKVLQLVNSAFFGVTREVSDIRTAVSYLGVSILQDLVLSLEAFRCFQPKKQIEGFSLDEFHAHAQLTAKIAGAAPANKKAVGVAVGAALLHDIGKLVIADRAPEHLARAIKGAVQDERPLYAIEEELIGVSHAEVGAYLLSLWGLPYSLVEAVAHHHHPGRVPDEPIPIIPIVYVSNLLAHEYENRLASSAQTPVDSIDLEVVERAALNTSLDEWRAKIDGVPEHASPSAGGS